MQETGNTKLEYDTAIKYLSIYLGETEEECASAVQKLWNRLSSKYKHEEASARMREIISFTIMYESYTKSKLPEKPINLLFWCQKYDELNEREWWPLFNKIIEEDKKIEKVRNFCLNLGVINPIEYSPNTRQAFNWVKDKCSSSDPFASDGKIRSLIYAYGGNVICGVFDHDKEMSRIRSMPKHHSTYFFERLIYKTYSPDKIVNIKNLELKKTSPKLVVKLTK